MCNIRKKSASSLSISETEMLRTGYEGKSLEKVREEYGPKESRRILKNLITLAVAFVIFLGAYTSTASLQSSLNKGGLGTYSLATVFTSSSIASLFFLAYLLSKFTTKTSILLSIISFLLYIAAQIAPSYATLIPAAIILGVGMGAVWTAQGNYVSRISQEYAYLTGQEFGAVVTSFFGIFYFIFQTNLVWGNLVLTTVLAATRDEKGSSNSNSSCGKNFCPASSTSSKDEDDSDRPPQSTIYLLFGVFIGCNVLAFLIITFVLDPLTRYGEGCVGTSTKKTSSSLEMILSVLKQMIRPKQLLLIPITFFSTFHTAFFQSEFTAGYISCAWGVGNIGTVLICFGISASLSAFLFSRLIKFIGRMAVISIIIGVHVGADVLMLLWNPSSSEILIFYVIAAMYGIVEGVLSAQVNALCTLVFEDNQEPAFNNIRFWQGKGYLVAYFLTNLFCMKVKLYLIIGMAVFSFFCYLIVEISQKKASTVKK